MHQPSPPPPRASCWPKLALLIMGDCLPLELGLFNKGYLVGIFFLHIFKFCANGMCARPQHLSILCRLHLSSAPLFCLNPTSPTVCLTLMVWDVNECRP